MRSLVILDRGHQGVGSYAPNTRVFTHPDKNYYEGEFNQLILDLVKSKLCELNVDIFETCTIPNDVSLFFRADQANFRAEGRDALFISFHSNASVNHKARGFEVFIAKEASTNSFEAAQLYQKYVNELFPHSRFRGIKKHNYYVLAYTNCPAMLVENLFYDNIHDIDLLKDTEIQHRLAEVIFRTVKKYFNI
jgi:N-acetylmuramoyl-L-alanine amidase